AAATGLKAGAGPDLLIDGTLREDLVAAVVTFSARNMVEDHHAVAAAEIRDSLTGSDDLTGHFMPENARRRVRAGRGLLEIGATDPASVDANQYFPGRDIGHRHGLETNIVLAAIYGRAHRRRDHPAGCGFSFAGRMHSVVRAEVLCSS